MKKNLLTLAGLLIAGISFGQPRYEWGEKFNYNSPEEANPQLVLTDNYNSYLLTVTNVDGMLASHKVTIRKFDQKNQLVGTFTQEFKKMDIGTLYNYLGFKEINDHQVAVFAESYSNKEKKKDVYQYVFDKADTKFTTSLIVSWPIPSAMKSGTSVLKISENGRYVGLINQKDGKDPVSDDVVMLDGSTLAVQWKKEVSQGDKLYNRAFTVTNSGKVVILKSPKGLKLSNYLLVVSQENQEEKQFEEAVMLHDPKAISIGQADYLVDFNYAAKGLRIGDYENIMLYDIGAGKIVKNNKITVFNSLKDISGIKFTNIFLQNNEIHLFAEPKVKSGTRSVKLNPMSSFTTEEPIYKFGPPYVFVMSFEGELKSAKSFHIAENPMADFYHSFGLLNINGKYYINAGGIFQLYELPFDNTTPTYFKHGPEQAKDPYKNEYPQYVAQVVGYAKDAKKITLVRTHGNNQMSLVSIIGYPQ